MRLSDLEGRSVVIWGYGREGASAFRLLRDRAAVTVVTDISEPEAQDEVALHGAKYAFGDVGQQRLKECDVVVRSPGISRYRPEIAALRDTGVTFTTGTNLWFAENPNATVVGVTGTKGKSTSSSLLAHLLTAQGRAVELAGNIGRPLLDLVGAPPADIYVFELSAQQTSDLEYSPTVGVVTNLYREHLDWHLTEDQYFNDKLNMLRNNPDVIAVLNGEDGELKRRAVELRDVRWFGADARFHVVDDQIFDGSQALYASDGIQLRGRHNRLNICGVLTAMDAVGADPLHCAEGLSTFAPLHHRLEDVDVVNGITYVNDSISTTPAAALAALEALRGHPITILLGGYERGQQYEALIGTLGSSPDVRAVITLPDNGSRISAEIDAQWNQTSSPLHERAADLDSAIERASEVTPVGGIVLLSPAAPSYGRFKNFEERGAAFVTAVRRLKTHVT